VSDQLYDAWDDACNRVRELEQQLADANRRIEYLELCHSEAEQQLAEREKQNVLLREAMNNAMCMMGREYSAYCVLSKALDDTDDLSGCIICDAVPVGEIQPLHELNDSWASKLLIGTRLYKAKE